MKLWSVQEIEARNVEMLQLVYSIDVFQDYVKKAYTLKKTSDLTDEEVEFFRYAISANQQIQKIRDDARLYGFEGRLSGEGIRTTPLFGSRDPLGERAEIRIYTIMQEALQSMATLISDGEVEDIKTYQYGRQRVDMSRVVHTLMHNAAERIVELSARFGTDKVPKVGNASMQALLLRLQSISI